MFSFPPCFLFISSSVSVYLGIPVLSWGLVWTSDAFSTPAPATEASAAAAEGGAATTSAPVTNAGAGGWLRICLCVWETVWTSQWWYLII